MADVREITRKMDLREIGNQLLGQAIAKNALSGSGLRFSKGRTTMDVCSVGTALAVGFPHSAVGECSISRRTSA